MFRRFYDWAIVNAESPHAERTLFWLAFIESSFFPFPPDILLIFMVLANRGNWIRYFSICLAGSVIGGAAGYLIGLSAWSAVHPWFFKYIFSEATFGKVQDLYRTHDFWIVFTAAFTPIPYKVFTITAGVTQIDFMKFIAASVIGRGGRFILVAYLLHRFGPPIRSFIEKYLNLLTIVFTILLIGGFVLLKHGFHH